MTELERQLHAVLSAMSAARRIAVEEYAENSDVVRALAKQQTEIGKLLRLVEKQKEGKE